MTIGSDDPIRGSNLRGLIVRRSTLRVQKGPKETFEALAKYPLFPFHEKCELKNALSILSITKLLFSK